MSQTLGLNCVPMSLVLVAAEQSGPIDVERSDTLAEVRWSWPGSLAGLTAPGALGALLYEHVDSAVEGAGDVGHQWELVLGVRHHESLRVCGGD